MNKEQCEEAAALFRALDRQDRHIAGMKAPTSIEIIVQYDSPDEGADPVVLRITVPVDSSGGDDAGRIHGGLLSIFMAGRANIIQRLRALGATVQGVA